MESKLSGSMVDQFMAISRAYSDASIIMHEAIAAKAGLSGSDHKYLGLIIRRGAMTAGELAEATGLTTGAVTGLIDRLEKKLLVSRQPDKTDRRKVIIVPDTKNAMQLLGPIFSDLQKRTTMLISGFSAREIDIIERYFTSATEIMTKFTKEL